MICFATILDAQTIPKLLLSEKCYLLDQRKYGERERNRARNNRIFYKPCDHAMLFKMDPFTVASVQRNCLAR